MICDLSVTKYEAPEENSDVYNKLFLQLHCCSLILSYATGSSGTLSFSEIGVQFNP